MPTPATSTKTTKYSKPYKRPQNSLGPYAAGRRSCIRCARDRSSGHRNDQCPVQQVDFDNDAVAPGSLPILNFSVDNGGAHRQTLGTETSTRKNKTRSNEPWPAMPEDQRQQKKIDERPGSKSHQSDIEEVCHSCASPSGNSRRTPETTQSPSVGQTLHAIYS